MAQILFVCLYRNILEVGRLPVGVSSEKKRLTLDSKVVLWDNLLFDVLLWFVSVHLLSVCMHLYVALCECVFVVYPVGPENLQCLHVHRCVFTCNPICAHVLLLGLELLC